MLHQFRVFLDEGEGVHPRVADQVGVAQQRQHPQVRAAPGLGGAQDVSLSALFEVELGEPETVHGGRHRIQPLAGGGTVGRLRDEQAEPRGGTAADPSTQLVQLRDAEPVGVHDHHHGRVRDVDAHLDHGRRDQDVQLAGGELAHHAVLVVGR